MNHKDTVCVVIPLYMELNDWERRAVDNNLRVLGNHPFAFVYPENFDISRLHSAYPQVRLVPVSDEWLGKKNGIAGYNQMMLSSSFYQLFSDVDFILICHADAWIFRDELSDWCGRGYDMVAAPWPSLWIYRRFRFLQKFREDWQKMKLHDTFSHSQLYGHVGNGGLSLRRVSVFSEACEHYQKEIAYFTQVESLNEDVFWAFVPKLSLPTEEEAISFAFDNKPKALYRRNHHRLPMGCHGFQHRSRRRFWRQFIGWL